MTRRLILLVLLAGLGIGGWWAWNNNADLRSTIEQYVENGEFLTLEAKYTPEQIMDLHRKELLADAQHTYQDPVLKFYPYLLIDAKYTQSDKKTREGIILWGLVDGEMILDTETWDKTHGFEDAINADASRNDFKIMHALAKSGNLSRVDLQNELHLEADTLEPWIESVCHKKLVIDNGHELQLHFQNPKIIVTPQTKVKQAFVTKPAYAAQRIAKKYNRRQVEKITQAAFGQTFTIRNVYEVFLPVYCISVLNPDGTVFSSYWNALNGQQLPQGTFKL